MNAKVDRLKSTQNKRNESNLQESQYFSERGSQFEDNRASASQQAMLQMLMDNSPHAKQLQAFQNIANTSAQRRVQRQMAAGHNKNHQNQPPPGTMDKTIQAVWQDEGTGVLKWDTLRDGVRWYVVGGSSIMYYLIEGRLPSAHALFYKANVGFKHAKTRQEWLDGNDFDSSEKFSLEDIDIVEVKPTAARLWNNIPATFKSKNLDKKTQKPKGPDSTYMVGTHGIVRYKEATNETLSHPGKHICYINGGGFSATRSEAFRFRDLAKEKIVVEKTSGSTATVLLGNGGVKMTVSLVPIKDYRTFDFFYNALDKTVSGTHVGHPVK